MVVNSGLDCHIGEALWSMLPLRLDGGSREGVILPMLVDYKFHRNEQLPTHSTHHAVRATKLPLLHRLHQSAWIRTLTECFNTIVGRLSTDLNNEPWIDTVTFPSMSGSVT